LKYNCGGIAERRSTILGAQFQAGFAMYSAQFEVHAGATTKDYKKLATIKKLEKQQFLQHKIFPMPTTTNARKLYWKIYCLPSQVMGCNL